MGSFSRFERLQIWLAWHMPRRIAYWVVVNAVTQYSVDHPDREMGSITGVEASESFE